jgi:hypothetical protein
MVDQKNTDDEKTYSFKVKRISNFSGYKELNKWLLELHDRLNYLENQNLNNINTIDDLTSKLVNSEARINKLENDNKDINQMTTKPLFSDFLKDSITVNSTNSKEQRVYSDPEITMLNVICNESDEIKRKEKNLIIFGLPNSDDNNKAVNEYFTTFKADFQKVDKVFRFNKSVKSKANEPSAVLVVLKNKDDKFEILKKAKNCKDNINYSKTFLNLDLTIAQRQLNNKFITERKKLNENLSNTSTFYYGIRNNKILKIIKSIPAINSSSNIK